MDVWKAGKDVTDQVESLIMKHHHDLAPFTKEIAVLFREKASKSGGVAVLGRSKKSPPILNVLGDGDYKFIIELAADEWANLTDTQKVALLDHHLCACSVEQDKNGEDKFMITPPDFVGYRGELERHGIWREQSSNSTSSPQTSAIEALFTSDVSEVQ
jgi:hypothetical protein